MKIGDIAAFATVREAYGIPRDDKLKLRDFPTLNHVFQFVRDRTESAGGSPAVPGGDPIRERVLAIIHQGIAKRPVLRNR